MTRIRGASLWYLGFLAYLVLQPLFDPDAGVLLWTVTGASIVLFVAFWTVTQLRPAPPGHWSPALVALLGVLVVPVNGGATVFFVYAAAYAGTQLPRPVALRWLVALSLLVGAAGLISPVPQPYLLLSTLPPLVSVWIVGLACADERRRERESAAEQARVEHLSTLAERERIARDLHDLLGQTLTGIVVRAQLAQRLPAGDAAAEMAVVETMARDALTEVRATVSGWRQVSLDDELVVARDALAAAGVALEAVRDDDLVLTPSAESALALALREAVTNVVRHAGATRCVVTLARAGGEVRLEVADDGSGGGGADGNGLSGMRERITALGGTVRRIAQDGTALVVALPERVAA
ncbi:MAG: histidine kinase [Pseudonocardiales bacterium]|nr:histidine kinase [Pseudonocardiales bacterium]